MKLIAVLLALAVSGVACAEDKHAHTLSSVNGAYVLGSLENGAAGQSVYLLDTKTGRVWREGCIAWNQADKCTQVGFRVLRFGDGTGSATYETVEDLDKAGAQAKRAK